MHPTSTVIRSNDIEVIGAMPHAICRCGVHQAIGTARVRIGPLVVSVTITSRGAEWPAGVAVPNGLDADWKAQIEAAWLRTIGESWRGARRTFN